MYDVNSGEVWKADRYWCKRLTVETAPLALHQFVSTSPLDGKSTKNPTLAAQVYGGTEGLLEKLKGLRKW